MSKVVALHVIPRTCLTLRTFLSMLIVDVYFHHFQVLVDKDHLDYTLMKIYPESHLFTGIWYF